MRPTPHEILDAIIGIYCLERLGIHHTFKEQVLMETDPTDAQRAARAAALARTAVPASSTRRTRRNPTRSARASAQAQREAEQLYTVFDYLGWDPRNEAPPAGLPDVCQGCRKRSPRTEAVLEVRVPAGACIPQPAHAHAVYNATMCGYD